MNAYRTYSRLEMSWMQPYTETDRHTRSRTIDFLCVCSSMTIEYDRVDRPMHCSIQLRWPAKQPA